MIIIPVGAPGSGKGTQANLLVEKLGIPKISTGDIFRENIKKQTEMGKLVEKTMKEGLYISDEIVIELVKNRIQESDCQNGFILDGFPRTIKQLSALKKLLEILDKKINYFIEIHIDEEEMKKRLNGRWSCQEHDHTYHEVFNPPKVAGICDIDGSALYQRDDQKPEAVSKRIKTFQSETAPMIDALNQERNFIKVDGKQPIANVFSEICLKTDL